MEAVEVILILVGVAFIVSSFFVQEKLSQKEVDQIANLSENELKIIVENQVKSARVQVETSVEEIIDESLEITKRGLDKETNYKIMAVSEYSDTVLESMNKTHNEIMFLYSMLNDKHTELTNFASSLQEFSKKMEDTQDELLMKLADAANRIEEEAIETAVVDEQEMLAHSVRNTKSDEPCYNKNEQILQLHQDGNSDVEIAKKLGCGLGEVKLVLGLYKEVESNEV